jgi:aspartate beta-hydroxylase
MASTDTELRALIQSAERADVAGRREEAGRLIAQAQAAAPDHPLVLNAAGVYQLRGGDAAAAQRLLERAVVRDDKNPSFWINLASTYRKLGQPDGEMQALDRVLAMQPRHLLALLQKASLLEITGKPRAAAATYHNALATVPPGANIPETLRAALKRAHDAVRENSAALEARLDESLRDLRERHAGQNLERLEHCLAALVGKRKVYVPSPTFLYFPKLPALEFYGREHFAWIDAVEAATPAIRSEFERIFAEDADRLEPYIAYPEGVPLDQWKELNHSRRWSVFYLWRDGRRIEEHIARCPETARLISQVPLADVPDHAPTVFFSVLDAKSRIPPHTGVTNTRVITHLPLIVPAGCGFRVGSDIREWQTGRAWVFDDTMEHEAWNESDVPRAILIFDVWNPYLTSAERDLVRAAVKAIGEFNRGEVPRNEFGT